MDNLLVASILFLLTGLLIWAVVGRFEGANSDAKTAGRLFAYFFIITGYVTTIAAVIIQPK